MPRRGPRRHVPAHLALVEAGASQDDTVPPSLADEIQKSRDVTIGLAAPTAQGVVQTEAGPALIHVFRSPDTLFQLSGEYYGQPSMTGVRHIHEFPRNYALQGPDPSAGLNYGERILIPVVAPDGTTLPGIDLSETPPPPVDLPVEIPPELPVEIPPELPVEIPPELPVEIPPEIPPGYVPPVTPVPVTERPPPQPPQPATEQPFWTPTRVGLALGAAGVASLAIGIAVGASANRRKRRRRRRR